MSSEATSIVVQWFERMNIMLSAYNDTLCKCPAFFILVKCMVSLNNICRGSIAISNDWGLRGHLCINPWD